jgi:hypothetical protein
MVQRANSRAIDVMPAKAGIQYSRPSVIERIYTKYWIVRFRGR